MLDILLSELKKNSFSLSDVGELESLLSKQAPLEAYIEWLDSVVDRCVLKVKFLPPSQHGVEVSIIQSPGQNCRRYSLIFL